ncbi:MAG: alpha/beta hydrolase [Roseovarius sp.]
MRPLAAFLVLLLALTLGACGGVRSLPLLAAPAEPEFFFVSNRAIEHDEPGRLRFSVRRDAAMSFGTARIDLGNGRLRGARAHVRFPATPLPFTMRDGWPIADPGPARDYEAARAQMRANLAEALRQSGKRDIVLYIHGFNSHFDDTMETLARIWRVAGEDALPLAFSWPAGNPGAFAYFKDRESGEFSIFHLKETLRILAGVPGLNDIHIVAHSRGSDVVTSALRELVIEARAAGRVPRQSLRVGNLILAAPDLDFSVVRQRLIAERFGPAFDRVTVYINPGDSTLGLAQVLLAGTRFGRISFGQLGEAEREIFTRIRNVDFINVSAVTGASSHSYFRNNPEVLRDMAQVIVAGAAPESPVRNLEPEEGNFWRLVQARPAPRIGDPDR